MSSFSAAVNSLGQSGPPCLTPLSIRKSPDSNLTRALLWACIFLIVFTSCLVKGADVGSGTVTGQNNMIDANTHIGNDCIIGDNAIITTTSIGNGVNIASNQVIRSSYIGDGCRIGNNEVITNSYIGSGCKIANNDVVTNSNIGSHCTIGNNVNIIGSRIMNNVWRRHYKLVTNRWRYHYFTMAHSAAHTNLHRGDGVLDPAKVYIDKPRWCKLDLGPRA
ncbi:bifunctional protein GlmU-like isoform X1 [Ostrinia furnacalis]|uniref:bifunctional protein GlmU-like isoform X1 n=1 Tax=Ostrinia furnacalis TaxID=93504 RepID=UPI0010402ADD|nr:bifunctional protein GlmU-like isoform X1 [Ostrinia furnacalis]